MSGHDENDLSKLEQMLGGLRPSPAGFDRDRVMFQAGQAAHGPRRVLWPATTGLMTAVAACLGLFLALRAPAEPQVQIVYVERAAKPPDALPLPPDAPTPPAGQPREGSASADAVAYSYWRLQEIAARHGVDELPETAAANAGTAPAASTATSVWGGRSPASASSLFNSGVE